MEMEGLRLGMLLGGMVMAAVPVSLGIGIGIYVLRRWLRERRDREEPVEPAEVI